MKKMGNDIAGCQNDSCSLRGECWRYQAAIVREANSQIGERLVYSFFEHSENLPCEYFEEIS